MSDDFQPPAHSAPDTLKSKLFFEARLLTDFQVRTVHADVKRLLAQARGTLLDVGAGDSPYRHLVEAAGLTYVGTDIMDAQKFGYARDGIVPFDGKRLAFEDASVDAMLCTEVLEHSPEPQLLVNELHRVLKPGGVGLLTVPWSARYHYIPWDFHRFTPSALAALFAPFSAHTVEARGTDLTAIASKVLVACLRATQKHASLGGWLRDALVAGSLAPFALPAVALGHVSVATGLGSSDDPLGYSVFFTR